MDKPTTGISEFVSYQGLPHLGLPDDRMPEAEVALRLAEYILSLRGSGAMAGVAIGVTGTVAWFDVVKQFGFVALSNGSGDAFLHMAVLKRLATSGSHAGPRCGSGLRKIAASGGSLTCLRLIRARPALVRPSRSYASPSLELWDQAEERRLVR